MDILQKQLNGLEAVEMRDGVAHADNQRWGQVEMPLEMQQVIVDRLDGQIGG